MKEPTKAELLAANERLGAEVAAHRVLLAAIRELATVPKPAKWTDVGYLCALEWRLNTLRAFAGHLDDVTPDIIVRVLHDRAKELREEVARSARYELHADPAAADCGFEWVSADGLHHKCTRSPHPGLPTEHEAWTADGTCLRPAPVPSAAQQPEAGTMLLGQLRDRAGVGEPVDRPGDEFGDAAQQPETAAAAR